MDLKPGYKQTEVGAIPEDWEVRNLQTVCRVPITYGIVQCGPHFPNGVPYIRVSDMGERHLHVEGMLRTSPLIAAQFGRSTVQTGDLVYALRGVLGEVRQVSPEVDGANLTQGTARLAPNDTLASNYLLWALRNSAAVRQAEIEAKGTTFREITLADLRRIWVLIPSKLEQQTIAEALSDADAFIESLEQLIAKKRQVKQGTMQELLTGKKRLEGFNDEWKTETLGRLVTFLDGQRRPVKDSDRKNMQGTIPYYGASGIVDYVNDYLFDEELILLGEDGENILSRNCRLAFRISGKTWVNNHAHVLRPNPNVNIGFLADYLESLNYEQFNSGTAQPKLNKQSCTNLSLLVPPTLEEQTAIATILSDMDTEITVLETKLEKARQIKQGMMQELLTGRIRLVR
jgi:type I restriction enzyme, S subunit